MTMMSPAHPDPERLSALAEGDAATLADRGLTDHIAACPSCAAQVHDLAVLRSALADLPDRMPPRRLQYVPPVPDPASRGWRVGLGRAFAPLVVAGMVLILVGGVGATGLIGPDGLDGFERLSDSQGAPAEAPEITTTDNGAPTDAAAGAVPGARGALRRFRRCRRLRAGMRTDLIGGCRTTRSLGLPGLIEGGDGRSPGVGETEFSCDRLPDVFARRRRVLAEIAQLGQTDRRAEGVDLAAAGLAVGDMGVDGAAQALAEGEERKVVRIRMLHRPPPSASADV